jgi:hypothetical protein
MFVCQRAPRANLRPPNAQSPLQYPGVVVARVARVALARVGRP